MILRVRGKTKYLIRTEEYDELDPYGSDWITCGNCSKKVSISKDCKWINTGYIKYLDNVRFTPCCGASVDKELCAMVCVCCQRPACYLTPHTNSSNFTYEPGGTYHLDSCSECDGREGMESLIVEQAVHNKLNKGKVEEIKIKDD